MLEKFHQTDMRLMKTYHNKIQLHLHNVNFFCGQNSTRETKHKWEWRKPIRPRQKLDHREEIYHRSSGKIAKTLRVGLVDYNRHCNIIVIPMA